MRCPFCGCDDSRVTDSRTLDNAIRRRRECLRCGGRFTTYERLQPLALLVVKKDGRREPFNREKLLRGLYRACEKRPLPAASIEALATRVEAAVQAQGSFEVASDAIGERVMEALREVDQIAYIRFASVYRRFTDLGSLREALDELDRRPQVLRYEPGRGAVQEHSGSRGA